MAKKCFLLENYRHHRVFSPLKLAAFQSKWLPRVDHGPKCRNQ